MTHAVAASRDAADFQSDEGDSQSTLPLHLPLDLSASRFVIRPVTHDTAVAWYRRFHYLGDPSSVSTHWGIFAPDLGCMVSVGLPTNVSGVAGRLGLTDIPGNVEINRVARHPEMPHTTSRLVALVVKRSVTALGLSWCFSYADTGQGHHGGIYQALGAVYVGLTKAEAGYVHTDGSTIHPRQAVSLWGTRSLDAMAARGFTKVPGLNAAKHTYVLPVGPRTSEVRERLRALALPYPKR